MPFCDKCGRQCKSDELFRGGSVISPQLPGMNPNTPQARGYYLLCASCKKKQDAKDSAVNVAAGYVIFNISKKLFFLLWKLVCFLLPAYLGYSFNLIIGIVLGVIGVGSYIFVHIKAPRLLKKIALIILAVSILLGVIIYFFFL